MGNYALYFDYLSIILSSYALYRDTFYNIIVTILATVFPSWDTKGMQSYFNFPTRGTSHPKRYAYIFSSPELMAHYELVIIGSVMRRQQLLLLNYWLDFDQTWQNDPYLALFNNCSKGLGPLHIYVRQAKIDFRDETFKTLLV